MRIITLNAWGGRALYPLMKFIERYAPTTDVFCFQEVFNTSQEEVDCHHPDEYLCGNLYQRIERLIGGFGRDQFTGEFAARPESPTRMSQALFYRNSLSAVAYGDQVIHQPERPVEDGSAVISGRLAQFLMVASRSKPTSSFEPLAIINYHGLWGGGDKADSSDRLNQSRRLRQLMDQMPGPVVLCGDLNLLSNTESLRLLDHGHRNMVTDYGIVSTRTPLYRHYEDPLFPKMADYVILSDGMGGIKVRNFWVLSDLVSDHAPLLLDIDW
jgi:hypothetical protein